MQEKTMTTDLALFAELVEALQEIADQQANHAAVDRCTCTPKEMLNEARAIARAALTTEADNG